MTNVNYSVSSARDLVTNLNDMMVFLQSGCVPSGSTLESDLKDLMMDKILDLDRILCSLSSS